MNYLEFLQKYAIEIYTQIFKELQNNRKQNVDHLLKQLKIINKQIRLMNNVRKAK